MVDWQSTVEICFCVLHIDMPILNLMSFCFLIYMFVFFPLSIYIYASCIDSSETIYLSDICCVIYRDKVLACAKHFVGDGGTTRGINENNTVTDWHGLLSTHMPGYYHAIIKGVGTIMVSYSSWNDKKMHANRDLVTNFLKGTLRFRV